MKEEGEPFWAWPGWGHLSFTLLLELGLTLWWLIIYGAADYLTGLHGYRVRLHLDCELRIPFIPEAVLGYMSIYPLFWMAPFILRTRREVTALAVAEAAITLVAGAFFLVFPGELLFPPPGDLGAWTGLVRVAKRLALTYNLMPSLHVAMSGVCILVYAGRAGWIGKTLLGFWALLIGLSTLLLHQHYLIDVLTGYLLAYGGICLVYRRLAGRAA